MSPKEHTDVDRPLTRFYLGQAVHSTGRTLHEILAMDDTDLDRAHNMIQWLFPSDRPSVYWINAPFLSKGEVALFRENTIIRKNYISAFYRYIGLFGIRNLGDKMEIGPNFNKDRQWLYPNSHSFERITTILESLYLLGFTKEAHLLLKALKHINKEHGEKLIDKQTLSIWAQIEVGETEV